MSKRQIRPPSQRQLRVGEELRHVLADVLRRGDFRDPELQKLNVTVTEVRVSPDLRNATAFVTPLGGENPAEAVVALRRAAAYFRTMIARAVKLRCAPMVSFEADTSFDYASHIDSVLRRDEVARDLAPRIGGTGDDAGLDEEEEDEDGAGHVEHNNFGGKSEEEDDDADDDADEDDGDGEGEGPGQSGSGRHDA